MAIFDQIIGSLTGESSLRRIRDRSIQAGRSAYDPTVLNPQIGVAQQQAVQGIDEGSYRRDVMNQLFRPVSSAVYGGNQAAAIAGASAQDMARTRALGTFESQLAQQDIQAKQAGAEKLGQLQSSQLQIQGQRDSYIDQVNAEFEAEKDSRRMELGASVAKFGIEAAGGAGAIGGAIGNKFQNIFGKIGPSPQDIVQSGANMAAERSLQMATEAAGSEGFDFGALDFGDNLRIGVKDQDPLNRRVTLRDVVNRGMQAGARTFDANNPIPGMPMPFSVEDPGDFPRWTPPSQAPRAAGAGTTTQVPVPTTEQILTGQSKQTTGYSSTFDPFKALFVDFPKAAFNEITRSRTAPIRLESIQNSPQMEQQLVDMIKNQPTELQNYSPEIRRYLLNKYSDLRGLFQ
jgi:hypothetical protein